MRLPPKGATRDRVPHQPLGCYLPRRGEASPPLLSQEAPKCQVSSLEDGSRGSTLLVHGLPSPQSQHAFPLRFPLVGVLHPHSLFREGWLLAPASDCGQWRRQSSSLACNSSSPEAPESRRTVSPGSLISFWQCVSTTNTNQWETCWFSLQQISEVQPYYPGKYSLFLPGHLKASPQ